MAGAIWAVTQLEKGEPKGVSYETTFDTTVFVQASIDQVVTTLLEAFLLVLAVVFLVGLLDLVDDAQFAESYVRSRASSRKLSRSAIRRELATRGVTGELAESALEQRTDEDEHDEPVAHGPLDHAMQHHVTSRRRDRARRPHQGRRSAAA